LAWINPLSLMSSPFLFARMASPEDLSPGHRCWNGNDQSQHNHHSAVPMTEDPLDLVLNWKASATAPAHHVGCFRLNLAALLSAGYVRPDKKRAHVRLRFFHAADDCIYIEAHPGGPRLLVGKVN
jgi:hypothetical protein